ncbi:MAG: helix-turn-helix transcriptional regulator [Flavobacteriales bacterium]|nr:helix-turn-helix transcriptional regulator [Flavobacteriales bacterium]
MESIGELIRKLRVQKGETLRTVATHLGVDVAVLSKIERGQRWANRQQVLKLARYFEADRDEMLVAYLSDRILYEIDGEGLATEALKVAEEKFKYSVKVKNAG